MKLDINKQSVDSSVLAVRKAHYITDIKVTGNGRKIELHGYAKVPVFGRIWSFLRHVCVKQSQQDQLEQQVVNFKDFHEQKAAKYIEHAINTENDFDDLIEKTYNYYKHADEISCRFLRQPLQSFHSVALNKFNAKLSDEELNETEKELGQGNLQAASERIEEIKTLSGKVDMYIAAARQHLQMTPGMTAKQNRLRNILAKHDTLEKIEKIMTENQLAVETEEKIPALRAIIDQHPVASDDETKAFAKAMEDLLPHLKTHFPSEGIDAQDFCNRFKRLNKQIACKQAIDAMHHELTTTEDPEKLIAGRDFDTQYQKISQKANRYKDSEDLTAKFEELQTVYEYWDKYNQLVQSDEISEEEINENGFFDKLIQEYPEKTVAIIAKMGTEEADAAIQKALPNLANFKVRDAKEQLIALANQLCTLPEYVKYRIEKTISERNLVPAHFEKYINNILTALNTHPNPSAIASREDVKKVQEAALAMDENDMEKYSPNLKGLCDALEEKMTFWNEYHDVLQKLKGGSIPEDFKTFFNNSIQCSPRNAMTLLAYAPEQTARQQRIKANAFVSYLTWHSKEKSHDNSLLMPENMTERELFLAAAHRLSIFNVYNVFKNVAMPEFVKIHAREAGRLFCTMLDGLIGKILLLKGMDTIKVINELSDLKAAVSRFEPKKGSIEIIDFLTYFRKDLVGALSKLPCQTFLRFDYDPTEETLVWCKPYASESGNVDSSRPLRRLYAECVLQSLISSTLNRELNEGELDLLTEHFDEVIAYDRQVAYKILIKLKRDKGFVEALFKSYENEKPFHDLNISHKEKDALLQIVCESIFEDDKKAFWNFALEIRDQKVRDPLLEKYALELAKPETNRWSSTWWRDSDNFTRALQIADQLGEEHRNHFYKKIVLETKVEMKFSERLSYALKISAPLLFGECPRDKVLVKMLRERSCWDKFDEVEQILSKFWDKKKYQAEFLDIVQDLCKTNSDKQFARLIAAHITDKEKEEIAQAAINGN